MYQSARALRYTAARGSFLCGTQIECEVRETERRGGWYDGTTVQVAYLGTGVPVKRSSPRQVPCRGDRPFPGRTSGPLLAHPRLQDTGLVLGTSAPPR